MRDGRHFLAGPAAAIAAAPLWLMAAMPALVGVGFAPAAHAQTCLSGSGITSTTDSGDSSVCIYQVPANWELVPEGLEEGNSFRLLFATSTQTQAVNTQISYYNDFAAGRAGMGHSRIQPYADAFKALVTTSAVDARTNTQTDPTASYEELVPVYWLNGDRIAENYQDLYDGAWENEAAGERRNESGGNSLDLRTRLQPWTGTAHNGTRFRTNSNQETHLGCTGANCGSSRRGIQGHFNSSAPLATILTGVTPNARGPLTAIFALLNSNARILAVSPVFKVGKPAVNLSVHADSETPGDKTTISVLEGDTKLKIVAKRSAVNTGAAIVIPVRVREAASTASKCDNATEEMNDACDYKLGGTFAESATITIDTGKDSGEIDFDLIDNNIKLAETTEVSVIVELGDVPQNAEWSPGTSRAVTITIEDNEGAPRIGVGVLSGDSVTEALNVTADFIVYSERPLISGSDEDIDVNLEVQNSVLDLGRDYAYGYAVATELGNNTAKLMVATDTVAAEKACMDLGFGVDASDVTAYNCVTYEVNVDNDSQDEPDGEIRVQVLDDDPPQNDPKRYTANPGAALVTVWDDDPTAVTLAPSPSASNTMPISLREGEETTLKLTIGRRLAPGEKLTVPLTFAGGTADRDTNPNRTGPLPDGDYTLKCAAPGMGVSCSADLGGTDAGGVPLAAGDATVVIEGHRTALNSNTIDTAVEVELTLTAEPDRLDEAGGETVMIGIERDAMDGIKLTAMRGMDAVKIDATPVVDSNGNGVDDTTLSYTIADQPVNGLTLSVESSGDGLTEGGGGATLRATLVNANATGRDIVVPVLVRSYAAVACGADDEPDESPPDEVYQEYWRACTAAQEEDYVLAAPSIVIEDGQRSGTVAFTVVDDAFDEPDETVTVEVDQANLPALGNVQVVNAVNGYDTFVIQDNDPTRVTLAVSDAVADEGDITDDAAIDVELGRALGWSLVRQADKDLECAPEKLRVPLVFAGGVYLPRVLDEDGLYPPLDIDEDGLYRGDEVGDFTLSPAVRGRETGVGLEPNPPVVVFESRCATAVGTDALAVVTLYALAEADLDEETIEVSLGNPVPGDLDGGVAAVRPGDGRIRILDATRPEASFVEGGRVFDEPDRKVVTVTVRLEPAPKQATAVGYTVTGTAEPGVDFEIEGVSGSVGYVDVPARGEEPPGDENPNMCRENSMNMDCMITVNLKDDQIAEGDEELTLTLFEGSSYTVADLERITIQITDNDNARVAAVPEDFLDEDKPMELVEGEGPKCYSLNLTSDPGRTVTVVPRSNDQGAATAVVVDSASEVVCGDDGILMKDGKPVVVAEPVEPKHRTDRIVFTGGACDPEDENDDGKWCVARTVMVSPADDEDGRPEPDVEITHTVLGYEGAATFGSVHVRVADKEPTACFATYSGDESVVEPMLTKNGACDPSTARGAGDEDEGDPVGVRVYLLKRVVDDSGTDDSGKVVSEPQSADCDITLIFRVSGSALAGADYEIRGGDVTDDTDTCDSTRAPVTFDERANAGTVTVKKGAMYADIEVNILDDDIFDVGEVVIFTLAGGGGYVLGGNTFELTIEDNDKAKLEVAAPPVEGFPSPTLITKDGPLRLREGAGPACYNLRLLTDPGGTVTVRAESSNPGVVRVQSIANAECGNDAAPVSDRMVFTGGACDPEDENDDGKWCRPQQMRVTPLGDADSTPDEARINHVVRGFPGVEKIPQVYVKVVDRIEAEFGAPSGSGTGVDLTESSVGECAVAAAGNGAADCEPDAARTVEVRVGLTRPPAQASYGLAEEEPFRIDFLVGGSAAHGSDYVIMDSGADSAGAAEACPSSDPPEANVCFDTETGEGAVRIATGLTLSDGDWHYAVIPVRILEDSIVEGPETVIIGLRPGEEHTVGGATIHTLTILDDDEGAGVTVAPTSLRLTEGGANGAYTVVLNTDPEGEVGVIVETGNVDSVTVSTVALTFTSDNWDVPQTVSVSALDDLDGADERATLFHVVVGYGAVASAPPVDVTVIDDDDDLADTVVSVVAGGAIDEGGTAEFIVSATPVPEEALTVNVTVADSGDFAQDGQAGSRPVTIGSDGTARLTVATVDDGEDEPDGRIEATIEPGRGYTVASPPSDSAAVPVADGDDPLSTPRAAFAAPVSLVQEGVRVHEVTIVVRPAPETSIAVNYELGGTATPDEDYLIAGAVDGAGAIAVAAGEVTAAIPVILLEDNQVEGDETVMLTLTAGRGYEPGAAAVHTLTLADDDNAGVSVSERTLSVTEGGANRAYDVVLGTDPGGTVTVTPFLDDPGAAAVSGSLSFTGENWRTPQTVVVSALDDADADDETVTISHRVSGYPGVDAAPAVTVTVIDDDVDLGDPVVSIAAGGAIEEGSLAIFTLRADPPPRAPFAVNVTVTDGGGFAAVGQAGSRPATIGPGGTATLTVATVNDLSEEADGALIATVVAGPGYAPADWPDNQAAVDVADNDGPPPVPEVEFTVASAEVGEGDGSHVATISIDPPIDAPFTLAFTVSGAAAVDADYTVGGAGVTFDGSTGVGAVSAPSGGESVNIELTIVDDGVNEPGEAVVLTLRESAVYTIPPGGGAHTLSIADDDAAAGLQAQAAPALARLGRSLAEQLMLGVDTRLAARRREAAARAPGPAFSATFAGRSYWLDPDAGADFAAHGDPGFAPLDGAAAGWPGGAAQFAPDGGAAGLPYGSAAGALLAAGGPAGGFGPRGPAAVPERGAQFEDLLRRAVAGSSFLGAGPQIGGGELGFWGRGAATALQGASDDFALDGSMTSVQLGADWTGVWLTAGLMFSQGDGEGRYRQGGVEGDVEMTLSSIVPYLGYQVGERVSLWSALSVSVGDLALLHAGGEEAARMDLSMQAFAAGGRGEVYRGDGAFSLSVVSDVFAVGAETDPVPGLPDVEAGVSRLRLAAEGAWTQDLPIGARLTNRTELGLRVDGGDAEEGVGAELANVTSLAGGGLTAELEGRRMLLHADEGFSQYGVSFYLAWDPMPQSPAGPVASVRRAWGIDTASGVGRLYRMKELAGFGAGPAGAGRAALEVGWGVLWLRDLYVLTPTLTGGGAGDAREAGLGLRLAPSDYNDTDLSAGFGASWRGPSAAGDGAAAFEFSFRLRW